MSMIQRILARLDIKGPNLVKGVHLEGLRVLGKPEDFARQYYRQGADELFYQDVVASLYERNSLHDIISRTAAEIFIPLTVGGGLRSVEDIRKVLLAGADKIAINTAATKNPAIISEAANIFGSSTICVAIESIRQNDGRHLASTDNGRNLTEFEVVPWAREVERLGAGEILLTSVDRDGTGKGFDLELTRAVASAVRIPVIAHGGAGSADHVADVLTGGRADAAAVASILHYDFIEQQKKLTGYEQEGNIEFLKSGVRFKMITPTALPDIKERLAERGVPVRRADAGGAHA